MSATILIISGLHAIPPIVGACLTKRKVGLTIGAIVGCVIAIALGGGAYAFFDLIGVIVGCVIGYNIIEESTSTSQNSNKYTSRRVSSSSYIPSSIASQRSAQINEFDTFQSDTSYIVGDRTTVIGKVAHVACLANRTMISIGNKFPREEISLLIWSDKIPAIVNTFGNLELLTGKTISCDGSVSVYRGHLQVKITNPSQLTILDD